MYIVPTITAEVFGTLNDGKLWTTYRTKLQCPTKSLSSDWWIWKLRWLCCITWGTVIVELFPQKIYLRKHSYSDAAGKYLPGHCDSVPTTRLLVNFHHLTYRMIRIVSTKVACLCDKYTGVIGTQKHVWTRSVNEQLRLFWVMSVRRQSVANGQVTSICTSVPFTGRGKCAQVTSVRSTSRGNAA